MKTNAERMGLINSLFRIIRNDQHAWISSFILDPIPHNGAWTFYWPNDRTDRTDGLFVNVFPDRRVEFGSYEGAISNIGDADFLFEGEAIIRPEHPFYLSTFGGGR